MQTFTKDLEATLRAAARQYADDTGEDAAKVEIALRRLVEREAHSTNHPVVSGALQRFMRAPSRVGR